MLHIPSLYIAPSPLGGRGVFTSEPLEEGSIIEISPVIVLPAKDLPAIHRTYLHDYYFLWEDGQCAIALGYGSLYNHAEHPVAEYGMDYADQSISFYCIRAIEAGEEITINYIAGGNEKGEIWFEPR
ncbi:SET domain-containing protein [Flavilitoribacter nigricans]|uniref:SET domain-containing protein-lysine N-methyltransferase n=1 Tax=Flavilitoribacter nigricans (strain ATCC 23147 / DSM 23189 / NBRC 102662 / NCIMB 1420 / SS-2) TaxID=1122177 RepID=A0A2D0N7Y9_FLAN2|nr:SET domain-containing protein [Flavilitoribacter nigricans]PHN04632.1 SET domain-containing protein-lysine N-methyltransferase [Flavilitoribacter nigricans DSM 23189 = NBRC 102662]